MALLPMRGYKRKPFPSLDTDNEGIKHFIVDEFQRLENTLETHKQAVDVTVTENEVVKTSVTSLTATVATNTADITTEQTTRANADSALASDITSLTSTVGSNTSAITAEQTARANADSALASDITSLTATVGSNTSAITSEQTTRANADTALASDITSLTSTVNGVSASVTTEASTRASADTALGSDITTLEAKYGVKLNVNGYITGFQQNNDGTTGSFKILADEFKVVNPSASSGQAGTEVFGISGNQVTMQNVKVGTAVIDDLAVTNVKIANSDVDISDKAVANSVGRISGTAGNDVNMSSYSEISQTNFIETAPHHIAAANSSYANVSAGDVMGGSPLFSYTFTTHGFSGNRDFIVSIQLDPLGGFSSASGSGFAFAMRATSSSTNYTSTSESSYVTTRGTSKSGTIASSVYVLSDIVSLTGNTQYYIWVFGVLDDISQNTQGTRGIRDGQITVMGLNK